MGKTIPDRALALDSQAVHISVREAARLLGVTERCVYYHLQKGKLTRVPIDGLTMVIEEEVLALKLQMQQMQEETLWQLPVETDGMCLTTIVVPVRPGCEVLVDQKLAEFQAQGKHYIANAPVRAVSRTLRSPGQLIILLFWHANALPPAEERERELAALGADLAEVCAWESALIVKGEPLVPLS